MKTLQERKDPFGGRPTATLVFGVAGRIGSGASFVTNGLVEELKAFGYTPIVIKVTEKFLKGNEIDDECLLDDERKMSPTARRVICLQYRGNKMREECKNNNAIGVKCVAYISNHIKQNKVLESEGSRFAYIIDSLKHPDEIDILRTVFREAFCMVGVVADDSVRRKRLCIQKSISNQEFEIISNRDADQNIENGQRTTKAILDSDYFFENNYDIPEKINYECKRLLNILFQSTIVTPRKDEYGMHLAFMAADGSACLSRQVGSAIISENGSVLATGCNDVPKFGGGLYTSESEQDNRCFARSLMCHNDYEKKSIAEQIVETLKKEGDLGLSDEQYKGINNILLEKTRLNQIIEFSRAVHAEMDAIIAVARSGMSGIVGSTMYVTTYPCHNCAKHIIDAGIKRVVFVEPYAKSLAQKLHSDAINNPVEEPSPNKVTFDNYGGISPERYTFFFSIHGLRKKGSKLIPKSLEKDTMPPLGAQTSEELECRLQQFSIQFEKQGSCI
jgi:deoxycytidylate deaminase